MTSTPDPLAAGLGATPDPLAACVEAFQLADDCHDPNCFTGTCKDCVRLGIRAAAPLLLEAVVADLRSDSANHLCKWPGGPGQVNRQSLFNALTAALARLLATPVGPATTEGEG